MKPLPASVRLRELRRKAAQTPPTKPQHVAASARTGAKCPGDVTEVQLARAYVASVRLGSWALQATDTD